MIEKHIVNIGFPRTGTTWLWELAEFEPRDKENNILTTSLNFSQYIDYYKKYQISANFQTNLWCVDREIIKFVHQHATHISVILRNPFDFIERYVDWIHTDEDIETLTDYIVTSGFVKYCDIVDRWSTTNAKFQIFFFEDLERDPFNFFKEYMNFCQIPIAKNKDIDYTLKVNANKKQNKIKLKFTNNQINFINREIDQFQSIVDKDLRHWKNDTN
jgi:hypothetical protein